MLGEIILCGLAPFSNSCAWPWFLAVARLGLVLFYFWSRNELNALAPTLTNSNLDRPQLKSEIIKIRFCILLDYNHQFFSDYSETTRRRNA